MTHLDPSPMQDQQAIHSTVPPEDAESVRHRLNAALSRQKKPLTCMGKKVMSSVNSIFFNLKPYYSKTEKRSSMPSAKITGIVLAMKPCLLK